MRMDFLDMCRLRKRSSVTTNRMLRESLGLHQFGAVPNGRLLRDEPRPDCRGLRLAVDAESVGRRKEGSETGRAARIDTSRPRNRNCPSGDWRGHVRWWRAATL